MINTLKRFLSFLLPLILAGAIVSCSKGGGGENGLSSESRLSAITLEGATFDGDFDKDKTSYDAELDGSDPVVVVNVKKMDDGQTVFIDGSEGTGSSVTVTNDVKSFAVIVKSEDKTKTRAYAISIRKKSEEGKNAYLKSLSVENVTLSPAFGKTGYSYSGSVTSDTESAEISFELDDSDASVQFDGVLTTKTSHEVDLAVGNNVHTIHVISADTTVSHDYSVTITRSPVVNTTLSGLELSSGALTPSFSQAQLNYTSTINCESITLTPTASDSSAAITVDGASVDSGDESDDITFSAGQKRDIKVIVSKGGSSTTYTVSVTRTNNISGEAYLSGLASSCGTVNFQKLTFGYSGFTVGKDTASITVTPTAEDSSASIKINGTAAVSGSASSVALAKGVDNLIDITVTDGAKTHTYLMRVTREGDGGTGITGTWVNILVPASWGWSGPYIYYWTDTNTSYCTWTNSPKMTSEGSDWYSYNVPTLTTLNAICKGNNNANAGVSKTSDMKNLSGEVYITLAGSTWSSSTTQPAAHQATAAAHGRLQSVRL